MYVKKKKGVMNGIEINEGLTVLEIPCGGGRLAPLLSPLATAVPQAWVTVLLAAMERCFADKYLLFLFL